MKQIFNKNIKTFAIISLIIILGSIGIAYALQAGVFKDIALNVATTPIDVNITYDKGVNGANITSTGKIVPINDNLVTGPDVTDNRVLKAKFKVSGSSSNPSNTIYDIALRNTNIDCELRTEEVKWRLYKKNTLLSEGNLSPTFDTMKDNRLVLTEIQENLTTTPDEYIFLLWISESCTGDITNCDISQNQNKYLNKKLSGILKVEVSTKSKKKLIRLTGSKLSCNYGEVNIPISKNLVYNGHEQILVNSSVNYTLTNNKGTDAGEYTITASLKDNYKWSDGTTEPKTLNSTIAKRPITVTALSQEIKYGSLISNESSKVSVSNIVGTHKISSITLTPSITEVGTGTITASNVVIVDSRQEEVTSNYQITYEKGNITITS